MKISVGSYLVDVPDVAVGAIGAAIIGLFGALIALAGVLVTNLNARKQQTEKLRHDALQADRARQMQIRRDVYLQSSGDIAAFIGTLGRFTSLDFPVERLFEPLERLSQAMARIQLVADATVLTACGDLHRALAAGTFEIQRKRLLLELRQSDIEFREKDRQDLVRDINQIVAISKQYDPSEAASRDHASRLLKLFESSQKKLETVSAELRALHETQQQEQLQLARDLAAILKNVAGRIPVLISAVRAELEFPDVGTVLQQQQDLTVKSTLEELDRSLSQIQ